MNVFVRDGHVSYCTNPLHIASVFRLTVKKLNIINVNINGSSENVQREVVWTILSNVGHWTLISDL